ncbi:MAG: DMT family transporter [Candidatus Binatia bacterium]
MQNSTETATERVERTSERESLKYANLILAIILAALAAPIVKWLIIHGGKVGISNPNAISFCNLLFVGNLCSALVVLVTVGWADIWNYSSQLNARTSVLLLGNLLIGTVMAPVFLYVALESTMVTNLVLLTRIEAVAYSILGVRLFNDQIVKREWTGLVFITVGVFFLALFHGGGKLTTGDALGILAGILYAIGSAIGRSILKNSSIAGFIFTRNLLGSIIFFWLAIILYGAHHFAEAFSADLWAVMTVYASLVVVLGQLTWFRAVSTLSAAMVSAWSTLTPVLGVLIAYLLLHEVPDMSQWVGAAIILSGLSISQIRLGQPVTAIKIVEKGLAGG